MFRSLVVALGAVMLVVGCSSSSTAPRAPLAKIPFAPASAGDCEDRSGYYVRSGATTRYSDSACTIEIPQ